MILKQGVGKLLSIDERDLRSRSINDLVMALKGVAGVSRLRIRQHGATGVGMFLEHVHVQIVKDSDALLPKDSSILNFSRPIKVYASQASASVDETKRSPIIAHASTVKTTTHGPITTGRTYPAKAIMQWNYTVREEYACLHPDAHLHRSLCGHTHTFKNVHM